MAIGRITKGVPPRWRRMPESLVRHWRWPEDVEDADPGCGSDILHGARCIGPLRRGRRAPGARWAAMLKGSGNTWGQVTSVVPGSRQVLGDHRSAAPGSYGQQVDGVIGAKGDRLCAMRRAFRAPAFEKARAHWCQARDPRVIWRTTAVQANARVAAANTCHRRTAGRRPQCPRAANAVVLRPARAQPTRSPATLMNNIASGVGSLATMRAICSEVLGRSSTPGSGYNAVRLIVCS
jgi:hypothetical protein